MAVTSDETQWPDTDPLHNPFSTPSHKSKSDQLVRIRRNQQRCRERKRAHVAELESQVEALQAKMRQCEPCASSSHPEPESAPETTLRENAARRDLLLALGFDDEAQQRFIESAAKRQAVYTVLQETRQRTNNSRAPNEQSAYDMLVSPTQSNIQSTGPTTAPANLRWGSGEAMKSFSTTAKLMNVAFDRQATAPDLAIEDWLFSPETLDKLPSFMEPTNAMSWFAEPYSGHESFAQHAVDAFDPAASIAALGTMPKSFPETLRNGSQTSTMPCNYDPTAGDPIGRCFLDTVVQFQPGETSIACSTALSLIFRHNRKGLSIAELQKTLKIGMRPPSAASVECRIEDSVLFGLLAYIST